MSKQKQNSSEMENFVNTNMKTTLHKTSSDRRTKKQTQDQCTFYIVKTTQADSGDRMDLNNFQCEQTHQHTSRQCR